MDLTSATLLTPGTGTKPIFSSAWQQHLRYPSWKGADYSAVFFAGGHRDHVGFPVTVQDAQRIIREVYESDGIVPSRLPRACGIG